MHMLPTITIDIGTTSVKLRAFDASSIPLASETHATPTVRDAWGEIYDVDALTGYIDRFIRGLEDADRAGMQRIAVTGVGESGGLVRADGSLASPMILWHDHRGADLLAPLDDAERLRIYAITGLPVNANYGLSKAAWALGHADDASDAQWLNVAEYVAARLTGVRWSEYSLASRTMALDLTTGTWSAEASALLGLDVALFPELRPARVGEPLSPSVAARLGLSDGVRVHVAGHDHMVGGVGADLRAGELLNSTGTTEGLLFLLDAPRLDAQTARTKLANGIACTGDDFTLFASIPTGGSAFATLQSMLSLTPEQLSGHVAELSERYAAGDIDLDAMPLVLPQFRGSPPPTKRASARGVVSGIRTDTTAADLIFGCFLGLALQFRDVLDLFGQRAEVVKVIGPAAANPLWLQLKADLLGVPLSVSQVSEVVSRGAQALASGAQSSWLDCDPRDIEVDDRRRDRLTEWDADIRPQWDDLKGLER